MTRQDTYIQPLRTHTLACLLFFFCPFALPLLGTIWFCDVSVLKLEHDTVEARFFLEWCSRCMIYSGMSSFMVKGVQVVRVCHMQ